MSDLSAGVTRYRRPRGRVPRDTGSLAFLPGVLLGSLVGIPAIVAGAGVALPAVLIVVPWRPLRYMVLIPLGVVIVVVAAAASESPFGGVAAFFATAGGFLYLLHLEYHQWWRRRLASAEGAAPAERHPRGHRDAGELAWWVDGDVEYEMVDPTVDVVLSAIRQLDGRTRSVVSVYRGHGRLDVAGHVRGAVLVQQSNVRAGWHQLGSQMGGPLSREVVSIGVMGRVVSFRRDQLSDRESAERAMRTWIERGERDTSLPWWQHPKSGDEENALRPATLKDTD